MIMEIEENRDLTREICTLEDRVNELENENERLKEAIIYLQRGEGP